MNKVKLILPEKISITNIYKYINIPIIPNEPKMEDLFNGFIIGRCSRISLDTDKFDYIGEIELIDDYDVNDYDYIGMCAKIECELSECYKVVQINAAKKKKE